MVICDIRNYMLSFNLAQRDTGTMPVLQPLTFSAVHNISIKQGVYTPNEDYEYLWNNIPAEEAPNFFFIQTPTQLNLSVMFGANFAVTSIPVNKVFQLSLPVGVLPTSIWIEGRTPQSPILPMPQGIPISYFCLMAKAEF